MYVKQKLSRMILASIIVGSITFAPVFEDIESLPIISSVAHAEMKTFTGQFDYPLQEEGGLREAREAAKNEAIRDAVERSGIAIKSETEVKNNVVIKDVINLVSVQIVNVISDKYKVISLDDDGGLAKMRATVVVQIDTDRLKDEINKLFKRDDSEVANIIAQNEELKRNNEELRKRLAELEKNAANAKTAEEKSRVKNEFAEIKNDLDVKQKIEEGSKYYYNQDYSAAAKSYDDALQIKTFTGTGTGEYIMSDFETQEIGKERAKQNALRNLAEQAGIFLSKYSNSMNLSKDEINVVSSALLIITDVKYERTILEINGSTVIKWRSTVTAKTNTNGIENWLQRNKSIEQLDEKRKKIEELQKKMNELKKEADKKK